MASPPTLYSRLRSATCSSPAVGVGTSPSSSPEGPEGSSTSPWMGAMTGAARSGGIGASFISSEITKGAFMAGGALGKGGQEQRPTGLNPSLAAHRCSWQRGRGHHGHPTAQLTKKERNC